MLFVLCFSTFFFVVLSISVFFEDVGQPLVFVFSLVERFCTFPKNFVCENLELVAEPLADVGIRNLVGKLGRFYSTHMMEIVARRLFRRVEESILVETFGVGKFN